MKKQNTVTRGSSNVFADLGLPNADEHMLKAQAVVFLARTIKELGISQQAAAKRMGISQPDVSKIMRGRFEKVSLARLLRYANALGSDVQIQMGAPSEEHEGRMSMTMAQ